ncbi:hypothetical protein WBU96_28505 [Bacillus albus]|uniref:hypothetical protein n=1 Tax=Bacillus albus TaxID=2026189 RepID=UPI0030148794
MEIKPRYIIAIYDTAQERDEANKVYENYYEGTFLHDKIKIEAVAVGQSVRGKRWNHLRISKVIDCTRRRPVNFAWWYKCVKPSLAKDCKFDNGERFDV